jgi:hypothetical protein
MNLRSCILPLLAAAPLAFGLALGGTALPVLTSIFLLDDNVGPVRAGVIEGGLILGPALGQLYAPYSQHLLKGLVLRGLGVYFTVLGISAIDENPRAECSSSYPEPFFTSGASSAP